MTLTINWDHTPAEHPVAGLQMVTSSVYCEVRTDYLNTIWKDVMRQHLTSGKQASGRGKAILGRGSWVAQVQLQMMYTLSAQHSNITTVAYTATHTIRDFNQFYELLNEF